MNEATRPKLTFGAVAAGALGGLIGGAAAGVAGMFAGGALAAALHVSAMEGGAGYFALSIAILVGAAGCLAGTMAALWWRRVRGAWLLLGTVRSFAMIAAVSAASLGAWYAFQPHILNTNGAPPLLELEVRPMNGAPADALASAEFELQTDRNNMPAYWHDAPNASGVRAGYVELYYRTNSRLLVLTDRSNKARIYRLKLAANPVAPRYRTWSEWQSPEHVHDRSSDVMQQPAPNEPQIRYRVEGPPE